MTIFTGVINQKALKLLGVDIAEVLATVVAMFD